MRGLALLSALFLVACAPAHDGEGASSPPARSEVEAEAPARSLYGQWQLTRVGSEPVQNFDMYLLLGDDWWHVQSQCVWWDGDFALAGDSIDFARRDRVYPDLGPAGGPVRVMCARGLMPAENKISEILAGAGDVEVEEDRLLLTTKGGTLEARRKIGPILNPMQQTSVDPATIWGAWHVAALDGVEYDDAHMVTNGKMVSLRLGCTYYNWSAPEGIREGAPFARREPFAAGCRRDPDAQDAALLEALETRGAVTAPAPGRRLVGSARGIIRLESR